MNIPGREILLAEAGEGVLVTATRQEGTVWRIVAADSERTVSWAVLAPGETPSEVSVTREGIAQWMDRFDGAGIQTASNEEVLATDGEVVRVVWKARGRRLLQLRLVNPDLMVGSARYLGRLAKEFLGAEAWDGS